MSRSSQDHAPTDSAVTSGQSEMVERVAKAICANSLSGFCLNVGGDLGCKNGRGTTPHWTNCVANATQLGLSGHDDTARAAIEAMRNP